MTLIEQLRARRDAAFTAIEATIQTATDEERDLTEAEDAEVVAQRDAAEAINGRIDELVAIEERRAADAAAAAPIAPTGAPAPVVVEVNEPELYREDGEHDFVRDVARALVGQDSEAATRLAHHNEEHRATVTGDLGGYVVPQHALDLAALSITNGRPFADVVTNRPLVSGTIKIPRQSSSTAVAVAAENVAGGNADFETNNDLTVSATTISGYTDLSVQSFAFSELDSGLVIADLRKEYDEHLDLQALAGTGASNQLPGLTTRTMYAGANVLDASGITSPKELWQFAQAGKAAVRTALNAGATHLVVHPEVFGWIESAIDSDGRPIFGHVFSSPSNVQGNGLVFAGLTVVQDANLAATKAIVVKADEVILWETGPATLTVDQVGAHTGTVRFVIRGFAAFTAERRNCAKVIDEIPSPEISLPEPI